MDNMAYKDDQDCQMQDLRYYHACGTFPLLPTSFCEGSFI
jgi:hypothetical protein